MHITHLHCEQNSMPYIENAVTSFIYIAISKIPYPFSHCFNQDSQNLTNFVKDTEV